MDTQISAKKDSLAKASAFEVQLHNANENSLVRTDMIPRLESELLKMKAEVVDARSEAEIIRAKADKKVAAYLKEAADARAELRGSLDQGSRNSIRGANFVGKPSRQFMSGASISRKR